MLSLPRLAALFSLSLAALASLPAGADEPRYNQIALRAEVSQEVAHDRMHVLLYSEAQSSDPAKLAGDITRTLNAAIDQARKVKGVTVSLGSRNSYPVYDEKGQKITAWRERAELRLESADFAALSQLTADLMSSMKMGGMDFAISQATRKQHEDALLKEAVAAFKARAQLATEALGGKGYKLVNLNLSSGGFPQPMPRMAMKGMALMEASAPAQDIEAGTSQITLNANGVIEVEMP